MLAVAVGLADRPDFTEFGEQGSGNPVLLVTGLS